MIPNVLFINLPTVPLENVESQLKGENKIHPYVCMPMGILYLSSSLKKNERVGEVGILDYQKELAGEYHYRDVYDLIITPIKKMWFKPDIISITLTFACSYAFFEKCVEIFKVLFPQSVVIVGGIQATSSTRELIKNRYVDYTLRGEGESAFPLFVHQISLPAPVNVKGIYSKRNYKEGTDLVVADMVTDLDTLPFPDWELIDMDYYSRHGMKKDIGYSDTTDKTAAIITSRGCPFKCTFCSSHTVHGRKMRFRSIENIVREIKALHERYGINLIDPEDDLFGIRKKRTVDLLHEIKSLGIPNLKMQFPNLLSINTMDYDLLDAMIGSGLTVVNLALESGSEYTQREIIKKNVNLKKTRQIVDYLRWNYPDVTVRCTVILGFPRETKELMRESIEFAKSLFLDWYIFVVAAPLPGSEMYKGWVDRGDIKDEPATWNQTHFTNRFFDTPEISADDLNDLVYRSNLELNFIHNRNYETGNYAKALEMFTDVVHNYPFHIIAWHMIRQCYLGRGEAKCANDARLKINELISTDPRAQEMYAKYGGYMVES